jgi:hypothetical protein
MSNERKPVALQAEKWRAEKQPIALLKDEA